MHMYVRISPAAVACFRNLPAKEPGPLRGRERGLEATGQDLVNGKKRYVTIPTVPILDRTAASCFSRGPQPATACNQYKKHLKGAGASNFVCMEWIDSACSRLEIYAYSRSS